MSKYKLFSVVFSYPDENFCKFFPQISYEKENLVLEYDKLFRSSEVWLYSAEYSARNEFQRAQILADINGFYQAFGLEVNLDRPDALNCQLEFMHYLIFKEANAPNKQKSSLSQDAQKKFFTEHLYPSAKKIAQLILLKTKNNFYYQSAKDLLKFLESEKQEFLKPS